MPVHDSLAMLASASAQLAPMGMVPMGEQAAHRQAHPMAAMWSTAPMPFAAPMGAEGAGQGYAMAMPYGGFYNMIAMPMMGADGTPTFFHPAQLPP
jgi:hypothetical protein